MFSHMLQRPQCLSWRIGLHSFDRSFCIDWHIEMARLAHDRSNHYCFSLFAKFLDLCTLQLPPIVWFMVWFNQLCWWNCMNSLPETPFCQCVILYIQYTHTHIYIYIQIQACAPKVLMGFNDSMMTLLTPLAGTQLARAFRVFRGRMSIEYIIHQRWRDPLGKIS